MTKWRNSGDTILNPLVLCGENLIDFRLSPECHEARERAFDHDADVRFRLKHEVPIFDKPFSDVAKEYTEVQRSRAHMGEITHARVKKIESVINAQLNPYVGNIQII